MQWGFWRQPQSQESVSETASPPPPLAQLKKEESLIEELPSELSDFYQLKTKEIEFKFPVKKSHGFVKDEAELASVQCADFQVEYLDCLTNGKFTDKFSVCGSKLKKFQNCLLFQKELFMMLGLSYVENSERLDDLLGKADDLTLKWFEKVDMEKPFQNGLVKEVLDEREKIWKQ